MGSPAVKPDSHAHSVLSAPLCRGIDPSSSANARVDADFRRRDIGTRRTKDVASHDCTSGEAEQAEKEILRCALWLAHKVDRQVDPGSPWQAHRGKSSSGFLFLRASIHRPSRAFL